MESRAGNVQPGFPLRLTLPHCSNGGCTMRFLFSLVAAALAMLWAGCSSEETVPLAYVASGGNNHVAVIDLQSGRTLHKHYLGTAPWKLLYDQPRQRLWVQHWYSSSTAVLDLQQQKVIQVLPYRGPGLLDAGGERFLTLSWPGSALHSVNARTLTSEGQRVTEVNRAYALALDSSGEDIWMAQYDPMAEGPHKRYAYLVSYPLDEDSKAPARSQPTGRSPVDIVPVPGQPFMLTADRGTNGLSLINRLGDGRAVPACPAPQAVLLSPEQTRMVVLCWDRGETRFSQMVSYRTDFATRPWPVIVQEKTRRLPAGLTRGAFLPGGEHLYLLDESGGRLLDVDPVDLRTLGEIPVGDQPRDLVIVPTPLSARDRLAGAALAQRHQLEQALSVLLQPGHGFGDLSWTETTSVNSEEEAGARTLRMALLAPDRMRSESAAVTRLAAGGWSIAIGDQGRFWTTPRQELAWLIPSLPNFQFAEAVRQLAGDVPGSPFLRGGLAVDLVAQVEEEGRSYHVIGALSPEQPLSQLWIDSRSGRPAKLVERFPVYQVSGHGGESFSGLAETRYHDWSAHEGGVYLPARLQRLSAGRTQEVEISDIEVDAGLPPSRFDLARLGGLKASAAYINPARPERPQDQPGLALPILPFPGYLNNPRAPHLPYNSNPPTSGPRLAGLAAWGLHSIPVPLELQVHNLEHGGILIQYNCPRDCPQLVSRLRAFIQGRDQVLVAPYPFIETRLALTAWGRLLTLEEFDEARMEAFLKAFGGHDHHADAP
ncbi:MAG TPA: DUF3105 domain-containing protein [Acidobacteriota bacterium]|nr:DUF3105 domain-containing protein [Acidobacteriota bacterium]